MHKTSVLHWEKLHICKLGMGINDHRHLRMDVRKSAL